MSELVYISPDNWEEIENRRKSIIAESSKDYRRKSQMIEEDVKNKARARVEALMAKAGERELDFDCGSNSQTGFLRLVDIEKHHLKIENGCAKVEHLETLFVFGKAILTDGTEVDPCVIYPPGCDYDNVRHFRKHIAGSSLKKFEPTRFLLPASIRNAATQTIEYRMGSHLPLLVSVKGQMKYLVPAFSTLFQCRDLVGAEVDPEQWEVPKEDKLRKGQYELSNNFRDELAVVYLSLPGLNETKHIKFAGLLAEIVPASHLHRI